MYEPISGDDYLEYIKDVRGDMLDLEYLRSHVDLIEGCGAYMVAVARKGNASKFRSITPAFHDLVDLFMFKFGNHMDRIEFRRALRDVREVRLKVMRIGTEEFGGSGTLASDRPSHKRANGPIHMTSAGLPTLGKRS